MSVRLHKRLDDGRYLFVKDGVYFSLTEDNATEILAIFQAEKDRDVWREGLKKLDKWREQRRLDGKE